MPCLAHQMCRARAIAAIEQRPRQREATLGRDRLVVAEKRQDGGVVAAVVPQSGLAAPAEEGLARPARVFRDENLIAFGGRPVVLAAQEDPFRQLARQGIADRALQLRGVLLALGADEIDNLFERLQVGLRRCRGGSDGQWSAGFFRCLRARRWCRRYWRRRGEWRDGWRAGKFRRGRKLRQGFRGLRDHAARNGARLRQGRREEG